MFIFKGINTTASHAYLAQAEITEHSKKKHERQQMFPCTSCGVLLGFEDALVDHVRRSHVTELITDNAAPDDVSNNNPPPLETESNLGNNSPKEALSNSYLAAILEQNIDLFDKINLYNFC